MHELSHMYHMNVAGHSESVHIVPCTMCHLSNYDCTCHTILSKATSNTDKYNCRWKLQPRSFALLLLFAPCSSSCQHQHLLQCPFLAVPVSVTCAAPSWLLSASTPLLFSSCCLSCIRLFVSASCTRSIPTQTLLHSCSMLILGAATSFLIRGCIVSTSQG